MADETMSGQIIAGDNNMPTETADNEILRIDTATGDEAAKTPAGDESGPRFEIAAAVVFRLGEELITDVVQALVELVKNSYDADASWVNVTIRTPKSDALSGSPEALGEIVVEDDGHGMDKDAFQRGWLMIADSPKKLMKDKGLTTLRSRTPVGDKGLGRLGVQRLGHNVEIISRTPDLTSEETRLAFSWRDFSEARRLSDVPVQLNTQDRSRRRSGTKITVQDLKDPDQWIGSDAKRKLQRRLSELISPFREVRDFSVTVTLDGDDVPTAELAERLRETASVRYQIAFDGAALRVDGKVRLNFVERAQSKEDEALLKRLLREDCGRGFFDFLKEEEKRQRPPHLEFHEDSKWFVTFKYDITLTDLGGVRLLDNIESDEKVAASPGPFHGEVDYILFDSDESLNHIWDSQSDFRRHVGELAGIRVYRDGFGVRVGEDWLQIGRQSTSGGSLYGLRPKNVLGFIAISARDNRVILETTSREGFQVTPHYQNFYGLLQKFIQWSSQAQEYLRRGALNYLKFRKAQDAGLDIKGEVTFAAAAKLREQATAIDLREKKLTEARDSMNRLSTNVQARVIELTADDNQFTLYHQDKLAKLNQLLAELSGTICRIQNSLDEYIPETTTIARATQILDVVLDREDRLRQELSMFYEGVALGLTAEALSHEIVHILHGIKSRSSALSGYILKQQFKDPKVLSYVEHMNSSASALRKQIAHLDPSLRYHREKRELLRVGGTLEETQNYYKDRFSSHSITMRVQQKTDFEIMLNRGKLSQIFDNILLNSEYWLRESLRKDPSFNGDIYAEVERPHLRFWDNGPGIALSVEDNLFDPFVTTKELGKGRGLGLFIVQQLLDVEGCSIELLHERNKFGRRFKFEINFSGALNA